jgi:hypothetical protein
MAGVVPRPVWGFAVGKSEATATTKAIGKNNDNGKNKCKRNSNPPFAMKLQRMGHPGELALQSE